MSRYSEEDRLTIACVRWFTLQYRDKFIMHIANERKTKRTQLKNGEWVSLEGVKLKKMGVRKGVSDLFIPEPSDIYNGLWIELKRDKTTSGSAKNYPDPDQREFLSLMHDRDYAVVVAWNLEEFIAYVNAYFKNQLIECDYLITNNHINYEYSNRPEI